MQIHAKQAVTIIQSLPTADELRFLDKQPGNKKLITETNRMLVGLMSDIKSILGQSLPPNQLTVPFKSVEDSIDEFLENAGLQMDLMKQPEHQKPLVVVDKVRRPKDIYNFANTIQLNMYPFIPVLKCKHFGITELDPRILIAQSDPEGFFAANELDEFAHPYEQEILQMQLSPAMVNASPQIVKFKELGQVIFINTVDELGEMAMRIQSELDNQESIEIAVDLEHHHQYSYLGITCLIQLSTRTQDYIIDPFPLWNHLGDILGVVLANPRIVKVLHGADNDVQWLQRDFGLYIVNLFDTYHASKELLMPSNSFAYLLQEYCKQFTDKTYQTADWSQRPLSNEMLKYAQMDTHYLLYIYDRMKVDLSNMAVSKNLPTNQLIEQVYRRSRDTSMKRYRKPLQDQEYSLQQILQKQERTMSSKHYQITLSLLEWREQLGIKYDENPRYFLPNATLFKLVDTDINNIRDLTYYLGGDRRINTIVKDNLPQLLKLLLEQNQNIKVIEIKQETAMEVEQPRQVQEIHVDPIVINEIPVTIQKYQNNQQSLLYYEATNCNSISSINQLYDCESSFKLLNIFYQDLGTQIFESMKSYQQSNAVPDTDVAIAPITIGTSEFMEFPKEVHPPQAPKTNTDIRLAGSLESNYNTKLKRKFQNKELNRAKKQETSNRFQM